MKFLFLFMDGVGLSDDDPVNNPLAQAEMPVLQQLLNGNKLVAGTAPLDSKRASLRAIDPNLAVDGLPQSATGQAALLTGKNVPKIVGEHYGPKPNQPVRDVILAGNLFTILTERGYKAALLNAYPQQYFDGINSGKHLYSAIPEAVTSAEITLKTKDDYYAGDAMAVDFTGEGWRTFLGFEDAPVFSPQEAGEKLANLATSYDFSFFEFWPSDYAGHKQDNSAAITLLELFDKVLGGLLDVWDDEAGLILITSDHGNMEDLSTRRHTDNLVPAVVIGAPALRERFTTKLENLADVAPAILEFYP